MNTITYLIIFTICILAHNYKIQNLNLNLKIDKNSLEIDILT